MSPRLPMSREDAKAFAETMEEFVRAWMVDNGMDPEKHIRAAMDYFESTIRDCAGDAELAAARMDEYLTRQQRIDESSRLDDATWISRWLRS